jgi:3-methyl-2-oxobutanoate hydroxymethyltransferase
MSSNVTVEELQRMKRDGQKIVAVVAYDYQMAQIADRAGVDIVSVGDSVGVNLWGHSSELEVTLDQMVLVCQAVRRGVTRALVSCDCPYGPLQDSTEAAVHAAVRLVNEGGADLVKLDAAALFPERARAVAAAGIPVWAQFGITPHTAFKYGRMAAAGPELATAMKDELVRDAKLLEESGASVLDFTNSGAVAGPAVVQSVSVPVLGGLGGGPWLDGRVRSLATALGYLASAVDDPTDRYANVGASAFAAIKALCDDIRAARQLRGAAPGKR